MKKITLYFLMIIQCFLLEGQALYNYPTDFGDLEFSLDLLINRENVRSQRTTINFWGGFGFVDNNVPLWNFNSPEIPIQGLEIGIEKRRYLKYDKYSGFSFSAFLGGAFMTNFKGYNILGPVPGFSLNYKFRIGQKYFIEPYSAFIVPFSYELPIKYRANITQFFTIGIRFCHNKLIEKT